MKDPGIAVSGDSATTRRRWRLYLSITACAFLGLLILLCLGGFFIPVFDAAGSRRTVREASAVGTLRRLIDLEGSYSNRHPAEGFACQLNQLNSVEPSKNTSDLDSIFTTGTRGDYKFALMGCESGANGGVTRYQLTAEPVQPNVSRMRAFCADQDGVIWYDETGSAEVCLSSRHPI
jgi:hypothetical protein